MPFCDVDYADDDDDDTGAWVPMPELPARPMCPRCKSPCEDVFGSRLCTRCDDDNAAELGPTARFVIEVADAGAAAPPVFFANRADADLHAMQVVTRALDRYLSQHAPAQRFSEFFVRDLRVGGNGGHRVVDAYRRMPSRLNDMLVAATGCEPHTAARLLALEWRIAEAPMQQPPPPVGDARPLA